MDVAALNEYFRIYGWIFIFGIVFCEYLNLPGFPAGVIMPLAGVWASRGEIGFIAALTLSVLAGICGSWALYFIGRFGGHLFLPWYYRKFPKQEKTIKGLIEKIRQRGGKGLFVSKLIPMVRTIISIPAGIIQMNFLKYTVYSSLGIFVWNFFFVGAGYLFGDVVIERFI